MARSCWGTVACSDTSETATQERTKVFDNIFYSISTPIYIWSNTVCVQGFVGARSSGFERKM